MGDKSAYEKVSYRLNLFVVFFYMYLLCAFDLLHACEKKTTKKPKSLLTKPPRNTCTMCFTAQDVFSCLVSEDCSVQCKPNQGNPVSRGPSQMSAQTQILSLESVVAAGLLWAWVVRAASSASETGAVNFVSSSFPQIWQNESSDGCGDLPSA